MGITTAHLRVLPLSFLGAVVLWAMAAEARAAATEEQMDRLAGQTVKADCPGCAVLVVDDGKIVFRRAYGIANVDTGAPITTATAFNIESVTKQFTAACIALLVEKGEIALDDDIRKYLPEMPQYEWPIKIRHLIHHTSGIRDFTRLAVLKGIPLEAIYPERELLQLIARQKQLSFRPGETKRYCNSGYFLLGLIVKRVTNMSVGAYAEREIFTPLGMTHTAYHYDPVRTGGNLAVPHVSDGAGKYRRWDLSRDANDFGYGGIYTTIEDLYRWDQTFFENKIGGEKFNALMLTRGTTNNDDTLNYAFGLEIRDYKGLMTVSHGGGSPGYNAFILRFPERKFSVICLANYPTDTGRLCYEMADLYLNLPQEKSEPAREPDPLVADVDPAVYARYEGVYRMHDRITFIISTSDKRLFLQQIGAPPVELRPKSTTVYFLKEFNLEVSFSTNESGAVSELVLRQNGHQGSARRLDRPPLQGAQLAEYEGQYYSDELDVTFGVHVKGDRLCLEAPRLPDIFQVNFRDPEGENGLKHIVGDQFMRSYGTMEFARDDSGKVTGFSINVGDDLRDVRFRKP
jgi:CubicO group peptidase (beta-lactamase class C family)